MSPEEIIANARSLTSGGTLYALFLMLMHTFDFEELLGVIASVRQVTPSNTCLVVNIGDFDAAQARELKAAGVSGAYHVRRLREGEDTTLDPAARLASIRAIKEAGLDWYNCCEPIGPEHTSEELADQLLLGREYECFQHAAMRQLSGESGSAWNTDISSHPSLSTAETDRNRSSNAA
jgi:biotin synthase